MAAVGALTAFIMQNSSLLPVVLSLSITQLLCFVAFVFGSNYSRRVLVNLFWVEAVCIVTLYFLVNSSLLAILSIVWIVQAAELYGSRSASWLLLGSVSFLTASALYHRSEEHTSELQSQAYLVCRLLLEKKKKPTHHLLKSN